MLGRWVSGVRPVEWCRGKTEAGVDMSREKQAAQMQDQSLAETRQEPPAKEMQPQLPPEIQGEIGRQLRQAYGQLLAEPLPDRFSELLSKLSKKENS